MHQPTPKDVDSYIAESDPKSRPVLTELRALIKSTVPEVEEKISYNVPFYKYYGEFVGFAAYKSHVSFGYGAGVLSDRQQAALEQSGYKLGKGTMQIKFDQEVPAQGIRQILETKAKINKTKKLSKV